MEKLNVKHADTDYVYAADVTKINKKDGEDITKDILPNIGKRYQGAINKILKVDKHYLVILSDGYTAYGKKERLARRIPEIGFIARVATEEVLLDKKYTDYIKEFKQNKIDFDGVAIPEFIDTIEDVKARKEKEEAKAKLKELNKDKKTKKATTKDDTKTKKLQKIS